MKFLGHHYHQMPGRTQTSLLQLEFVVGVGSGLVIPGWRRQRYDVLRSVFGRLQVSSITHLRCRWAICPPHEIAVVAAGGVNEVEFSCWLPLLPLVRLACGVGVRRAL